MKTLRLILLGTLVTELAFLGSAHAQVPSARRLTQKIAPARPAQTNAPAPATLRTRPAPAAPSAPAPTRSIRTQTAVRLVQPPVDPEKARAAKEEALRRTIEFQKKRAEEGSESAQYELGLRYLKGDGVVKDEVTGRKWLGLSAKSGYGPASRKLEELDQPADPPKDDRPEK